MGTKAANVKKQEAYMSDEAFSELTASFKEAIAHARGENTDRRVTRIKVPPSTKAPVG